MVIDKFREVISVKQNKGLEKYTSFSTQKRIKAKNEFENVFYINLSNSFYGKIMKHVRNRVKLEFDK